MSTPPVPPPAASYSLVSATKSVLTRYAVFSGRACRSEYWFFQLALFIVGVLIGILAGVTTPEVSYLSWVVQIAVFVPCLALMVRRLHDTGRSAWNLLWVLLPVIGGLVLLIFAVLGSEPTANKYGEAPLPPVA